MFLLIETLGCGDVTAENCTYFDSDSTTASGGCTATICPCNDNICQVGVFKFLFLGGGMIVSNKIFLKLRIDFIRFVITGPSTTSTSEVRSFPI